jgi:hypothetical protein
VSNALLINKQTEAEKDDNLLECFYDAGFIEELIQSSYSIISGRKGSGKTAIARYLEKNPTKYGVGFVHRLSIRNFNTITKQDEKTKLNNILIFIVIKTVQKMLNVNYFSEEHKEFWKEFLLQNDYQNVADYETFLETQKSHKKGFSIKGALWHLIGKAEGATESSTETHQERTSITKSPSALFDALQQTVSPADALIVFIDDISDYLDESGVAVLQEDINVIKDLLLALEGYNLGFREADVKVRFVSLIREDLFEFMSGSNINKLKSDSLKIEWNEKSFCSLLLRRMPQYKDNLSVVLADPVQSIKTQFPDEIFASTLKEFATNRYGSNFYGYMVAISFNRPRDFLQFCYALRNRLSSKHPATFENIESAEIEYADYFIQELRDELFIASKVFGYDLTQERINQLVDLLSKRNGFNASELKGDLAKFMGEKTSLGKKKIELLLTELWRYGVIGVAEKKDELIRFKYLYETASFTTEKIKQYTFYLHRGLWWFAKKRKSKS